MLIYYLGQCGWYASGDMGIQPLTAQGLTAWAQGTATDLGAIDFQDMLDASRAFVGAFNEYRDKSVPAPWTRDMTPEEAEAAAAAEERYFDMLMGVT